MQSCKPTCLGLDARNLSGGTDGSKIGVHAQWTAGSHCDSLGRMGEPAMMLLRRLAEMAADGGVNKQRCPFIQMKRALRN